MGGRSCWEGGVVGRENIERDVALPPAEKRIDFALSHSPISGVDFEGPVIGYAGVDTMCRSSCSSVNYNSRSNARFYATVIAHELGHNFGMYHDSG